MDALFVFWAIVIKITGKRVFWKSTKKPKENPMKLSGRLLSVVCVLLLGSYCLGELQLKGNMYVNGFGIVNKDGGIQLSRIIKKLFVETNAVNFAC